MTCALLTIGTASNSKLARVLPIGRRASARWRSMRRRLRSATSCSARPARKRAAGQPSLSDCSAIVFHISLTAGRRRSVSSSSSRALSGSSSCQTSHAKSGGARRANGGKFVVGGKRRQHDGDVRNSGAIRGEALAQSIEVRQLASVKLGLNRLGELGLAGAVMGERQQAHGGAAGVFLALLGEQRLEGACVSAAREQLIAIDQVEERHRLPAQRVDEVAVVDDVSVFAAPLRPTAASQGEKPGRAEETVEPVVIEMDVEAMTNEARGNAVEHPP